jgi:hypothetical protein
VIAEQGMTYLPVVAGETNRPWLGLCTCAPELFSVVSSALPIFIFRIAPTGGAFQYIFSVTCRYQMASSFIYEIFELDVL